MKSVLICSFFLLSISTAIAQNKITISEGHSPQSGVSKSFTTTITQVDLDFVKTSWNTYLQQQNGSVGIVTKNGNFIEIETEHVALPALEGELVDIIALLTPSINQNGDDVVTLTIYMEREDNTKLTVEEDTLKAQKIKNWLLDFDKQLIKNSITRN